MQKLVKVIIRRYLISSETTSLFTFEGVAGHGATVLVSRLFRTAQPQPLTFSRSLRRTYQAVLIQ